jgi:hypothetical protein
VGGGGGWASPPLFRSLKLNYNSCQFSLSLSPPLYLPAGSYVCLSKKLFNKRERDRVEDGERGGNTDGDSGTRDRIMMMKRQN